MPFGGVQMLFAGDVFQMPPIINTLEKPVLLKYYPDGPYFFNSKSYLKINPSYIEFRKVYRQKDKRFVEALEDVRRNRITPKLLNYFNQRVVTNFNEIPSGLIILAPTNLRTYQINNTKLNLNQNKIKTFKDVCNIGFLMVDFSDKVKNSENEIRFFLKTKMYNNKNVLNKNNKGKLIIKKLFNKIKQNPNRFISKKQLSFDKFRAISDFISGMTDRYAINLYNNIK